MKHILSALFFALLATQALAVPATPTSPADAAPQLPKAPEPIEPILRLQIFLDTRLFGPGKVDGRPGEFTDKALKRYQASQGLPETDVASNTLDLCSVGELYTTYTVRQEDLT